MLLVCQSMGMANGGHVLSIRRTRCLGVMKGVFRSIGTNSGAAQQDGSCSIVV